MAEHKALIDFRHGSDTGQDNEESIQPVSDGEGASQVVFRRPTENLRTRTEELRNQIQDLIYHRDYGPCLVELATGSLTWGGASDQGGTGIITCTGTLKVSPILSPRTAVKGSLTIGTAGVNQITYGVTNAGYASDGMSAITVEHRASAGQSLEVTISARPIRRILVKFDANNPAHTPAAVKAALDPLLAADAQLAGKLAVSISAAGTYRIAAQAEMYLSPTADDESHWIEGTLLTNLTTARRLKGGDGVALWYRYVLESPIDPQDPKGNVAGGRAESSISRGNHTVPAASLFITSDSPSKITGAFPICRVGYHGQLIFADGTRVSAGESYKFTSIPTEINAVAGPMITTAINTVVTPAINTAITSYNTQSIAARDQAITTALSNYNTSTIIPQRTSAITSALGAYNTATIIPERTAAINTALSAHHTNTTIPAINAAVGGVSSGVTAGYVTTAINAQHTNVTLPAINQAVSGISGGVTAAQVTSTLNDYNNSTIIPQRTTAINAAIQGLSTGEAPPAPPRGVTAVISATTGGDHNGATAIDYVFNNAYPAASTFFVRNGTYTVSAASTATTPRRVYTEGSGYPYTTITLGSGIGAGSYVDLVGVYEGFSFTRAGAGQFRARGATLKNCQVAAGALTIMHNNEAYFENVTFMGPGTAANPSILKLEMSTVATFVRCKFVFASPATVEGGMLHIDGGDTYTFINCEFEGGNGPMYALFIKSHVSNMSPIRFDNCTFSTPNTAAGGSATLGRTVRIAESQGIQFSNCNFRAGYGLVLDQDGSNVSYDSCHFETWGTGTSVDAGPRVVAVGALNAPVASLKSNVGTSFRNCTIIIGDGSRRSAAKAPHVVFGGTKSGADLLPGPVHVDGLHISHATATSTAHPFTNVLLWGNKVALEEPNVYKNITYDMNANTFGEDGAVDTGNGIPAFKGAALGVYGGPDLSTSYAASPGAIVENLHLLNVGQAVIASTHHLLDFARVTAKNVTLTIVARSSAVWMNATPIYVFESNVENLNIINANLLLITNPHTLVSIEGTYKRSSLRGGFLTRTPPGGSNETGCAALFKLFSNADLSDFIVRTQDLITYPLAIIQGPNCRIMNCDFNTNINVSQGLWVKLIVATPAATSFCLFNNSFELMGELEPTIQLLATGFMCAGNVVRNMLTGGGLAHYFFYAESSAEVRAKCQALNQAWTPWTV